MAHSSAIQTYKRLLKYLKPHRKVFSIAVVAMIVYGATDGAIPYLLKHILDDIFGAQDEQKLWYLVGAILIFAVVRSVFGFLNDFLANSVGLRIIQDIRNELGSALLNLSASFYSKNSSGTLISRMTNDTLMVKEAITNAVVSMMRDSVRVIALLIAAIMLDPILALVTAIAFPICILPIMMFGKHIRRLSRSGQDKLGYLTATLFEIITGHKVIKAFSLEDRENKRFAASNAETTNTYIKAVKYGSLTAPTNEFIGSIAVAGVIVYGGLSVIGGVRTQGDFIAFITTMFLMYDPLKRLGRLNTVVSQGIAAADRIFEILDAENEIKEKPDASPLINPQGRITYENVFFSYATRDTSKEKREESPALADISLVVEAGTTVALVGSSGGGKSTLVNLLPRFYDCSSGRIFIGQQDICDVKVKSLRQAIALVSQQTFLFNDTVFSNIEAGRPGASREDVIQAAKAAHADDFISRLPQNYQTVVGEQGFSLSGGERARLAIARALLKNAPILILDEATANLDSESEILVQHAIERLMQGRTVLVIAHRLSTIRNADKIAVISKGRIVEFGTHEELMSQHGEYTKLYTLQFHSQDTGRIGLAS